MNILLDEESKFHPGLSIDCVIFGFDNGCMKVLLNKLKGMPQWMLPGGFVFTDEDVDAAAYRTLKLRTGLTDIYLRQFHLFGNFMRGDKTINKTMLDSYGVNSETHWLLNRFVTVGYYALVNFLKVKLISSESDDSAWFDLDMIPDLYLDHNDIVNKAVDSIRLHLNIIPIGKKLLPPKFTLPELRAIYEAILKKELDRRNFQRKILSLGFVEKLNEKRLGGAHKAPDLYCFNDKKYDLAMKQGIQFDR